MAWFHGVGVGKVLGGAAVATVVTTILVVGMTSGNDVDQAAAANGTGSPQPSVSGSPLPDLSPPPPACDGVDECTELEPAFVTNTQVADRLGLAVEPNCKSSRTDGVDEYGDNCDSWLIVSSATEGLLRTGLDEANPDAYVFGNGFKGTVSLFGDGLQQPVIWTETDPENLYEIVVFRDGGLMRLARPVAGAPAFVTEQDPDGAMYWNADDGFGFGTSQALPAPGVFATCSWREKFPGEGAGYNPQYGAWTWTAEQLEIVNNTWVSLGVEEGEGLGMQAPVACFARFLETDYTTALKASFGGGNPPDPCILAAESGLDGACRPVGSGHVTDAESVDRIAIIIEPNCEPQRRMSSGTVLPGEPTGCQHWLAVSSETAGLLTIEVGFPPAPQGADAYAFAPRFNTSVELLSNGLQQVVLDVASGDVAGRQVIGFTGSELRFASEPQDGKAVFVELAAADAPPFWPTPFAYETVTYESAAGGTMVCRAESDGAVWNTTLSHFWADDAWHLASRERKTSDTGC